MRIDQFHNLPVTNIIGARTYGSEDEFNTNLKKERYADPPEFFNQEVEDFTSYSETLDVRQRRFDEHRERRSEEPNFGENLVGSHAAQSLTRALVQQAVCMIAGAMIIAGAYQAMVKAGHSEMRSQNATSAENSNENRVDENGDSTGDETVNDTSSGQSPAVLPAGHTFELTGSKELGDGTIQLTYTCTDCGESYVVIISVEPEQ